MEKAEADHVQCLKEECEMIKRELATMEKQQRKEIKQQAEAHKKKTAELCKTIRQQHQEEIKLQATTYKQKTRVI